MPWNAWLHEGGHWHLEVVPRMTIFAGVELGAGIFVTTVARGRCRALARRL